MKITDVGAALDPQFERVEMSNLDKVFERNRITKQGIDAMITNYLLLERELVAEKEWVRQSTNSNARLEKFLAEAQAEVVRLKGEAESWEKVFDKTCEHLADAKTELAAAVAAERERCAKVCDEIDESVIDVAISLLCAAAIRKGE